VPIQRQKVGWPWTVETGQFDAVMPDGSQWPTISVVTPSYNQGQFIEETIRSVLLQSYPRLEYIIVDGGSTDSTVEIISRYEPWITHWVSEADRGQSHAINKGIVRANGDFVLWLNSDDICLPGAFRVVAQAVRAHPDRMLIVGQTLLIDRNGDRIGDMRSYFTTWDELVTNPRNSVRQNSAFFARRLFDELGLIQEDLHIAMDTELMVRFTRFHPPLILSEYLVAFRVHEASKTQNQLLVGYQESDRTRGRYLTERALLLAYRRRSSSNWLSLSEDTRFTPGERMSCLVRAFRNQPSRAWTRDFWSSLKRLCLRPTGSN
jgi:glycosyltransferase involved in cell wall biosynthesis